MSESAIRAQIFTILSGVPGIGKVYDYDRWAADWTRFISLFKDTTSGRILGWEISRKAAPAQYDNTGEEAVTHQYLIRGYMGLEDADATDKLFNALIELVVAEFRFNFQLNGTCEFCGPISVDVIEPRVFGSVLCHYCEISLPVQEIRG